jgi:hypothetical protein
MTRDLKHRVPGYERSKPKPSGTPHRLLMAIIGAVGAVGIGAGVWQFFLNAGQPDSPLGLLSLQTTTPVEPDFSAFRVFPDSERKIPERDINQVKREARLGKTPEEGQFFLQIGSFTTQKQAEQQRNRIEDIAKVKPRMEQITLEYATWYRLRLGPYRTIPDADQVRLFLREHQIDSIMQTPVNP